MSLSQQQFGCGLVRAPFSTSSGILNKTWSVVSSRDEDIVLQVKNGLVLKLKEVEGLTVVVFEVEPGFVLEPGLVSSSELKREHNFTLFESNKKFPDFSVNRSAVSLFRQFESPEKLKSTINGSPPPRLIFTGLGVGGIIASLFTLSLLDSIDVRQKRPLCITFGSPLVGDKTFQEAISRSSTWSSCFLHVVSYNDPLPKNLKPDTSHYMPFGTFLFCSDTNSTCFENPESVLELHVYSINYTSPGFQPKEYGNIVENLYRKSVFKEITPQTQDLTNSSSLRSSIHLQLWATLGLTPDIQQQLHFDLNTLVPKMETLEHKFIYQRTILDPSRKLNEMKKELAQLEWYKKDSKNRNIGYYDSYKGGLLRSDLDVIKLKRNLTNYWIKMVEEVKMKPQKEGAAFRTRWLYSATNYRRMVEPLDIADYYEKGGKGYLTEPDQRPRHYAVLEKWLKEDIQSTRDSNGPTRRNVELLLTVDSCFWAHVEEALLSYKQLQNVQSSVAESEATSKLREFEDYVYGLLKKYELSPEIFLKQSSYMKWWNQYGGISCNQELASFMSNPDHYNQYTLGAYEFP